MKQKKEKFDGIYNLPHIIVNKMSTAYIFQWVSWWSLSIRDDDQVGPHGAYFVDKNISTQ